MTCAGSSSSATGAPVRYPDHEDQTTQAHCNTLVVNARILSTTGYLASTPSRPKEANGNPVNAEAKARLSPAKFETINPYGTLSFAVVGVLERTRRPLRRPLTRMAMCAQTNRRTGLPVDNFGRHRQATTVGGR
jgi:hypothetical protein